MFLKNKILVMKTSASILLLSFTIGTANAHNRGYYHDHRDRGVGADLLGGAILGGIFGGKKGARNGAIAGAIIGGIKRNERRKHREWQRRQWRDDHWDRGW